MRRIELEAGNELRFEVKAPRAITDHSAGRGDDDDEDDKRPRGGPANGNGATTETKEMKYKIPCDLRLVKGNAEIFGEALLLHEPYSFTPESYAVFTWYGAIIEIDETRCKNHYITQDTPMDYYAGIHGNLELLRDQYSSKPERQILGGPRVAIVGPADSGKTSAAITLANYALRCDREPLFVDLNIGCNRLSVPGTIAAGFLGSSYSNGTTIPNCPLSFFCGETRIDVAMDQFKDALAALVRIVDKKINYSGMIIDTFPWTSEKSYNTMLEAFKMLQVDIVLVVGHDRLLNDLRRDLQHPSTIVNKVPRSEGVVARDATQRKNLADDSVRRYFEGDVTMPLSPARVVLSGSEIKIFRLHSKLKAGEEILPVGQQAILKPTRLTPIDLSSSGSIETQRQHLERSILAVTRAETQDELEDSSKISNVAGFLYVEKVTKEANSDHVSLEVLQPCPGPLPGNLFLVGSIKWFQK